MASFLKRFQRLIPLLSAAGYGSLLRPGFFSHEQHSNARNTNNIGSGNRISFDRDDDYIDNQEQLQICQWENIPSLTLSKPKKPYRMTPQGKDKIKQSNQTRKTFKKRSYANNLKLEICIYKRNNGGSADTIRNSPTYDCLKIPRSTMNNILAGETDWRYEVDNGRGDKMKNHKGGAVAYPYVEDPLKEEYILRKSLNLDV